MAAKADISRKRSSAVLRKQNMHIENCIENKQKKCLDRLSERSDEPKRDAKMIREISRTSGYPIRQRIPAEETKRGRKTYEPERE